MRVQVRAAATTAGTNTPIARSSMLAPLRYQPKAVDQKLLPQQLCRLLGVPRPHRAGSGATAVATTACTAATHAATIAPAASFSP